MRTKSGQSISPQMLDALADEAERGYDPAMVAKHTVGRPSLSGGGESPRVQFRVAPGTYARALRRAHRQGLPTMSALARALLDAYAEGSVSLPPPRVGRTPRRSASHTPKR